MTDDELEASLEEWRIERERQRSERIAQAKAAGDRFRAMGTPSNPWPYH